MAGASERSMFFQKTILLSGINTRTKWFRILSVLQSRRIFHTLRCYSRLESKNSVSSFPVTYFSILICLCGFKFPARSWLSNNIYTGLSFRLNRDWSIDGWLFITYGDFFSDSTLAFGPVCHLVDLWQSKRVLPKVWQPRGIVLPCIIFFFFVKARKFIK